MQDLAHIADARHEAKVARATLLVQSWASDTNPGQDDLTDENLEVHDA